MDTQVKIAGGPNEMQLMMSLMRPSRSQAPFGVDVDKGTSVHFATDLKDKPISVRVPAFSATVNKLEREDGSGHSWLISGHIIGYVEFLSYHGWYNSKTRKGIFILES